MKYKYQNEQRYFAQFAGGIEKLGCEELQELGAKDIKPGYRGAYFCASFETMCKINYQTRLATRILAPLIKFDCHSERYLYNTAIKINWDDFLKPNQTFAIFSSSTHSKLNNSQYVSLKLKDAICDYFKNKYSMRPSINKINPDVWFNIHINANVAVISYDTSLGSLHRRGYRSSTVKAPMQETLAATIIRLSGYTGQKPMLDPMCGSGTLLAEAWLKSCNIPAGFKRSKFGFMNLPEFDHQKWTEYKNGLRSEFKLIEDGFVKGNDLDAFAVRATNDNLANLPYGEKIEVSKGNYKLLDGLENGFIICNPPYGIRLTPDHKIKRFFKDFGDFLKNKCKGSEAWIYLGNRELIPFIGLKPSRKIPLKNGPLDGRLLKIELY